MKIADLTVEQFIALVEEIIDRKFEEYFGGKDEGLEFPPEISERLKAQGLSGTISPQDEQILKELGLDTEE